MNFTQNTSLLAIFTANFPNNSVWDSEVEFSSLVVITVTAVRKIECFTVKVTVLTQYKSIPVHLFHFLATWPHMYPFG